MGALTGLLAGVIPAGVIPAGVIPAGVIPAGTSAAGAIPAASPAGLIPAAASAAGVSGAGISGAGISGAGISGAGISAAVLAVTLAAACAHATWNSIAHGITDKLASFTLVCLGGLLCSLPLVLLAAPPEPRCWPYLALSGSLHVAYLALLMLAYRLGDFGQAYPLARGTSPLVVLLLASVFVGEVPGPGQLAGVVLICGGLAVLVLSGRRAGRLDRKAVLAAVATGLTIASYSTVDGVGVRLSGSVAGYTGWLMSCESIVIPVVALAVRRGRLLAAMRPVWHIGLLGGALSVLAYGLVLWAQTRGALASVAALRESSIVLAAVIGSVFFHEKFGRSRIVAAACVTLGICVLYLALPPGADSTSPPPGATSPPRQARPRPTAGAGAEAASRGRRGRCPRRSGSRNGSRP